MTCDFYIKKFHIYHNTRQPDDYQFLMLFHLPGATRVMFFAADTVSVEAQHYIKW